MDGNSNDTRDESPGSVDWDFIARHFSGETTPEDSARIEAIAAAEPEAKEALTVVELATHSLRAGISENLDVEAALARVKARRDASPVVPFAASRGRKTEQIPVRRWRVPMPALAAAALLAVGGASWMAYRNRPAQTASEAAPRMFATGVGVRDSITLADGSRVVLGPMSSIKIDAGFNDRSRSVEIRGDAFFEVVHNASRPFTVHAGNATIVDVGTRFAVSSDAPQGVTVAVLEGSVALQQVNGRGAGGVILKAGDKGLSSPETGVLVQRGAVTDDDAAWLKGRLIFREATVSEIALSIRKWYGIELKVEDPSIANRRLTATFAGESVDRVLDVIRLALGADIDRNGDTATVRESKGSMRIR